jgi:hypothetical protein
MIMQLADAIRRSILVSKDDDDLEAAADLLEASLEGATEFDGSLLLTMEPETMATMLQLSGTDPMLIGYVSRTLLLEASYLRRLHRDAMAELRHDQAFALAQAFGVELLEDSIVEPSLERFFEENQMR